MKILAIETSCDETAISVVEFPAIGSGGPTVLAHVVSSQTKIHEPFGGVVPNLAARAHQTNLIPVLRQALQESNLLKNAGTKLGDDRQVIYTPKNETKNVLEREPELLKHFEEFVSTIQVPVIDAIAVTVGPGLEPALWVGINFAKALALAWNKPLIPVNHMLGHVASVFVGGNIQNSDGQISNKSGLNFGKSESLNFPAVALLISGGHTEIILMKNPEQYELLGATRDDAVGEAFDKVARLLGLPYPGGPQISALAEIADQRRLQRTSADKNGSARVGQSPRESAIQLPRPMIDTKDFDFSFSGLKTAVRYLVETLRQSSGRFELSEELKSEIAHEFQEAVIEVLVKKTMRAVEEYNAKTLIVGGGVIANTKLRSAFEKAVASRNFADLRGPGEQPRTSADKLLYEDLTYKIRGAAYVVKKVLGVGQKESVYQKALEIEFEKAGLSFEKEKRVDIYYDGKKVGLYQPDFVVEDKIIVELKAIPFIGKNEKTQTHHYLKGSPYKVALLINFGGKDVEFERFVFDSARTPSKVRASQPQSAPVRVELLIPELKLTTDNATMIALAAYEEHKKGNTLPSRPEVLEGIRATGNLKVC